jgi:CubicO group peptidase (beta-lactamase class C family)
MGRIRQPRLLVFSFRAFLLAAAFALGIGRALAQTGGEAAPELLDRPPVAAPTSKVAVDAIPVVLSQSQEVDNFTSGLLQGLLAHGQPSGVAIILVKDDHVMLEKNLGMMTPDTRFAAGALSQAFAAVAAMQLIERGRMMPDEDAGKALGEATPRGFTIAQVLTRRAGDAALLARIIEKVSGAPLADTIAKAIVQPLGLGATMFRDGGVETSLTDMSHFAIALVNGGAFQSGRILEAATVEAMESTHFALHPALPGWAYGFSEMRRNGWRALQQDGAAGEFAARLVIVPEAKLAYVIAARGRSDAAFWRALDNGLFDRLLAPKTAGQAGAADIAAPTPDAARAVSGSYEPTHDPALLKIGERYLEARAESDGGLILSGAENTILMPRQGGYWGSADGNLNAVARDGLLLLSTDGYRPLAFYKRPDFYVLFALLLALAAPGIFYYQRRRRAGRVFPSDLVLGVASASVIFLLFGAFLWLFAPAA